MSVVIGRKMTPRIGQMIGAEGAIDPWREDPCQQHRQPRREGCDQHEQASHRSVLSPAQPGGAERGEFLSLSGFSSDDGSDSFDADDGEGERDERDRPAAGEEGSDQRKDEHDARSDRVGRPTVLQDGPCGAARLHCATTATDEPDSDEGYDDRG